MFVRSALAAAVALASIALAMPASAQTGGPDNFGYLYLPTTYDFVPLLTTTGATPTGISGTGEEVVTLPFTFSYYGNDYTQVAISAEGRGFCPGRRRLYIQRRYERFSV